MKKLIITSAITLGLALTSFADPNGGGGLFQKGSTPDYEMGYRSNPTVPMLPQHGKTESQDANGPLGSGIAVLLGLGAAYLVGKKRKEE